MIEVCYRRYVLISTVSHCLLGDNNHICISISLDCLTALLTGYIFSRIYHNVLPGSIVRLFGVANGEQ